MVHTPHPAPRRRGSARGDKAMANRRKWSGNLPPTLPIPRGKEMQIGQFVLSKTMGEGTFGEVKLAVHTPTSERVAAKVLEKSRIKTIADVKRVSREIKILKRVRHPNVIALYEVLDTPSTIYFMMEHCDGGELFDYIVRHQRLQEGQACFFFRQLVDGMEYLHEHDVTHRDLKPENLLLQSSQEGWRLKIIDFGLSNTHEGGKMLQTACGSPCYAAPEMIAGKSYQGPAADIWSCGVVLFTLVAGFLPFEDPNTSALYKKILSGSYEKPRWLSDGAIYLLSRILNTDPAKRVEVAGIRKDAWYLKAHPPTVRPVTAIYPAVPIRRSDLDDKLLARAVLLAGGGVNKPEGDAAGDVTEAAAAAAAAATAAAAAIESAAAGLLSGQHNAVATAYHLLLKKSVRRQNAMSRAAPTAGTEKAASTPDLENVAPIPKARVEGNVICGDSLNGGGAHGGGSRRGPKEAEVAKGRLGAATESTAAATAAVRPLAFHNSTSNDSSTSSAQSAQLVTARRRKPNPTARAALGVPLGAAAVVVTAQGPTPPVSKVAMLRPRDEPRKVQPQPANGSRHVRSPTVAAVGSTQGVDGQGDAAKGAGARVTLAASEQSEGSSGRGGEGGQVGPVPVLSFRKITRMGSGALNGGGDGGGGGRPATSSAFSSQTARTSGGTPAGQEAATDSANRRRGGRKYTHRDSAGAGSIGRNATNGRGGNTVVVGAPPRRPLTARAPLKSSAPTPRLSGEFSLTRPRGPPVATTGRVGAGPAASLPTSKTPQGNDPSALAGAPVAAESSAAPSTETRTATDAGARGSRGSAASTVVPSRTTARQPSLRVRLSTLSSKGPQRRRFSGRGGGAPVGSTTVAAATTAAAAAAAAAAVERKHVNSSRSSSRRSSLPSASPATSAAAAATTAAAPAAGVGSVRALWGKKSTPNGTSGIRAPQVSTKSWTRGGPRVFRQSLPADPAAIEVMGGGTTDGSSGRGQGGG